MKPLKGLFPENPLLIHELLVKLKDTDVSVRLAGNQIASDESQGTAFSTPPTLHQTNPSAFSDQQNQVCNNSDFYGEQDTEHISPYYLKLGCTTFLSVHLQATACPA